MKRGSTERGMFFGRVPFGWREYPGGVEVGGGGTLRMEGMPRRDVGLGLG